VSLLNRYKNALLDVVLRAGLDRSQIETTEDDDVLKIAFTPAELVFEVMQSPDSYDDFKYRWSTFTPSRGYYRSPLPEKPTFGQVMQRISDRRRNDQGWFPEYSWVKFSEVLDRCRHWIEADVRRAIDELSVPDRWSHARAAAAQLGDPGSGVPEGAEFFDAAERLEIRRRVQAFREAVVDEFEPDEDALKEMDEKLSYLVNSVDRLNRRDWKTAVLPTLVGVASALSLDTNRGRQLWQMFVAAFRTFERWIAG
jgi:hypothetical protein